ncbi:MAG: trypsin-like peptidase domain-containing protein, partial [bacterium]|nr:trypsin-like peptidase domain-containing protein [bacterium]
IVVKKEFTRRQFLNGSRFEPLELNEEQELETDLVEVSSGTGFFVTEDGYMLTNKHVVDEEGVQFFVVTNDGEELPAELVDVDPYEDIAIMKVEGRGFQVATLGDSENIKIGQTVIAIGNTLSEFRNTVTKGVVSGIDREITAGGVYDAEVIEEAIQTDAAINPGNSGGPLINLLGEVIGINTAVSFEGESVAFAIPINEAKQAVEDVLAYGRIIQPWLGVRYVLVTPEESGETAGLYEIGAWVVEGDQPGEVAVFPDSPADKAGLQAQDVIIAVNGVDLTETIALAEAVSAYRPGETITLSVLRDGEVIELEATLEEYQAE